MWTTSSLLPNCAGGYFKLCPLKEKKKKEGKEEEEPQAASVVIANGWAMSFLQALWFCTWLTSNSGSEPRSWWLSALVDCLTSSTGESAIYLCAPISTANWGTKSVYISIIFFFSVVKHHSGNSKRAQKERLGWSALQTREQSSKRTVRRHPQDGRS